MRRCGRVIAIIASASVVMTATIASAAAGAGSDAASAAPDKTIGPTVVAPTDVPTTVVSTAVPTLAPPTVVPLPSIVAPTGPTSTTLVTTTVSSTTVPGSTSPSTTTTVAAGKFDPLTFFASVFDAMKGDYYGIADIARARTVEGSPANWLLIYLLGVTLAADENDGPAPVAFTVAPTTDGAGLLVCAVGDDAGCDTFADFVDIDGRLSSFTINGLDLTGRFGASSGPTSAASLEFSSAVAIQRVSDEALGIVVLLTAGGSDVQIAWDKAVYVDAAGVQHPFSPLSIHSPGLAANTLGSAYLLVADVQLGGELVVPVSSDGFATSEQARVPIEPVA